MIKNNLDVKSSINYYDRKHLISMIANAYFIENDEGEIVYDPMNAELYGYIGFCMYIVIGIETDKSNENLLETVINDSELWALYDTHREDSLFKHIWTLAKETADFHKMLLLKTKEPLAKTLTALAKTIETDTLKTDLSPSEAVVNK